MWTPFVSTASTTKKDTRAYLYTSNECTLLTTWAVMVIVRLCFKGPLATKLTTKSLGKRGVREQADLELSLMNLGRTSFYSDRAFSPNPIILILQSNFHRF